MAARVFPQYQHIAIKTHRFGTHNFVGHAVFEHAVLVDARFMGKGIAADNRLVGGHRYPDKRTEQATATGQLRGIHTGRNLVVALPGV